MTKIKIAIVDDELLFIAGMKAILEREENFEVSYTASNGSELIESSQKVDFEIDIILLDLSMPKTDGIDTLRYLSKQKISQKIIILTSHYNDSIIIKLLDEGASGFLAKNESPSEVVQTINMVHSKGFYINDYIMQLIRNRRLFASKKQIKEELSSREVEVLKLICEEFSTKEIADKLFISTRTVEGHRNKILEKTFSKNVAGLVIYAIEHGHIDVHFSKYN
jgi:DNA-binding NarL/FixJ family response regulator